MYRDTINHPFYDMRNTKIENSLIAKYLLKMEKLVIETTPNNSNKTDSPYWTRHKKAYHLYLCFLTYKGVTP